MSVINLNPLYVRSYIICVYSFCGDRFWEKYGEPYEPTGPYKQPMIPPNITPWTITSVPTLISPVPIEPDKVKLVKKKKKRKITQQIIDDFIDDLKAAKKYDEETGQKDCELDEKKEKIRKLLAELGFTIEFP